MNGHSAKKPGSSPELGFTLIELVVAVAILGLALTTLIGLQTRIADNYRLENDRERAALYAQHVMSTIEVRKEAPELGSESGDLERILRKTGYFDDDSSMTETERSNEVSGWTYVLTTSDYMPPFVELPDGVRDILREVELTISWGEEPGQTYTLFYVMTPGNRR